MYICHSFIAVVAFSSFVLGTVFERRTAAQVLTGIADVQSQTRTLDNLIVAFPNTGGTLVAVTPLDSSVQSLITVISSTPALTEAEPQEVLNALEALEPIVVKMLADFVAKKSAFDKVGTTVSSLFEYDIATLYKDFQGVEMPMLRMYSQTYTPHLTRPPQRERPTTRGGSEDPAANLCLLTRHSALAMEHGDYNAVLAVIRPIMKTLPVLSNVLEGSVEVVQAISAQVEATRKNKEDLEELYRHAATVQVQVVLSLRDQPGDGQAALLDSVKVFVDTLKQAKVFAVKTARIKKHSFPKRFGHAAAQYFTATSTAGKIAAMKQQICDAAVAFGIAADIRIEQRVIAVNEAFQRLSEEQREAHNRTQRTIQLAEEHRERDARQQHEATTRVEGAQREAIDMTKMVQREAAERAEEQLIVEQRKYLDEVLRPAHAAAHYARNAADPCTAGTRVDILSALQEWAASDKGPRIYWLAGLAGTGKTTIASSFCRECQAAGVMVLSFFISRNTPDRNTITAVVSTISHQLAQVDSAALKTVHAALQKQPPILFSKIAVQTKELLVDPLTALLSTSTAAAERIVIVIDAMDECDDFAASDGRDLLGTLVPALCHQGHDVKLFLTSRYEPELRVMLDRIFDGSQDERKTVLLHEVQESYVSADIRTFVTKGFADIRERFPKIPLAWPPLYQVNELVELSGKLFVFASTVLLWIGEKRASPVSRLTEVLAATRDSRPVGQHERSPYGYLDALYLAVLRNATPDVDPNSVTNSRLRQVLFMVICGDYPVTLEVISGVLMLEDHELDPLLGSLSAVLQIPGGTSIVHIGVMYKDSGPLSTVSQIPSITSIVPFIGGNGDVAIREDTKVKAFHKSFPDFLVDPKRCSDERFLILRDREEPRLALAAVKATHFALSAVHTRGRVPRGQQQSVILAHLEQYWCYHLLNTLRNPNLDSTQVLSEIRTWLQAEPINQSLLCPQLTAQNLTNIRFLLAALVKKLPAPISTEFQQDLIALARTRWENGMASNMRKIVLHVTVAIVLHARISQAPETQLEPSDFVKQDRHFHRQVSCDYRWRSILIVSSSLREFLKDMASDGSLLLAGIQPLRWIAQECSSDLLAAENSHIALIKLLEICMISRLQYTVEPVIPWL
ncbi:hypothetical protein BKA62DRAFT_834447 [Auriculariales sp. MPI-PUGE-AT-0066]|nr:hypothetical protein BKA62DRAFT_834447 [Auriculariales sp. MPI-PUGE-AT-0066]